MGTKARWIDYDVELSFLFKAFLDEGSKPFPDLEKYLQNLVAILEFDDILYKLTTSYVWVFIGLILCPCHEEQRWWDKLLWLVCYILLALKYGSTFYLYSYRKLLYLEQVDNLPPNTLPDWEAFVLESADDYVDIMKPIVAKTRTKPNFGDEAVPDVAHALHTLRKMIQAMNYDS